MQPKISIIIPTFNCGDFIYRTIESVFAQTYKNYEIIIVDDGSTDSTKDKIDLISKKGIPINYIYQANAGPAAARNTGIRNAAGEYITFLDADDFWIPEKLELQVDVLERESDIGLVYGDVKNYDGSRDWQADRSHFSQEEITHQSGWIFPAFFRREVHVPTSTVMVRKECFNDVGLFDENMKKICSEDRDMFLRITRKYKAYYIHRPLVYWRIRGTSLSRQISKMLEGQKYVIKKIERINWVTKADALHSLSSSYFEAAMSYLTIRELMPGMKCLLYSFLCDPIDAIKPGRIRRIAGKLLKKPINDKYLCK